MTNDPITFLLLIIISFVVFLVSYGLNRIKKEAQKEIIEARRRSDDQERLTNRRIKTIIESNLLSRHRGHRLEVIDEEAELLNDEIRANYQQFMEFYGYTEPQLRAVFLSKHVDYDENEKPKREWHVGDDGEICYDDEE